MGYTTEYYGRFDLDRPLTPADEADLAAIGDADHGGDSPDSRCQWVPTADGLGIEWDGDEKFYLAGEWLAHLIENFFKPRGYALSGSVRCRGEAFADVGVLAVRDGRVFDQRLEDSAEAWLRACAPPTPAGGDAGAGTTTAAT